MADAASTGSVIVGALAGGTGVLVGTVVTQVVQLIRDKRQHEREDARHERERQDALEDERRRRREDRYVALLAQLTELEQALQGLAALLPELSRNRGLAEADVAAGGSGDLWRSLANVASTGCKQIWDDIEARHRDLSIAVLATYAVASPPVREHCTRVAEWELPLAGVHLKVLTDFDLPQYTLMEEPGRRYVDRDDYAAHLLANLGEFRSRIEKLDSLLRNDLRLD